MSFNFDELYKNYKNQTRAAIVLALGLYASTFAQDQAVVDTTSTPRLDALEETVNIHGSQLDNVVADVTALQALPKVTSSADGFGFASADGKVAIKFKGLFQSEGVIAVSDYEKAYSNSLKIRRVRFGVEGTVGKQFAYKFTPEFAGSAVSVLDASVDFTPIPQVALRAGKFRPGLGLEGTQPAYRYLFPDPSIANQFTPNRDVGVQLQGSFGEGIADYQLGLFNGAGDGLNINDASYDSKSLVGRAFFLPLKPTGSRWVENLGLGFSASYAPDQKGTAYLPTYKTTGGSTFFAYANKDTKFKTTVGKDTTVTDTVYLAGTAKRISPSGYWYTGPFGIQGEFTQSSQAVAYKGKPDIQLYDNSAWNVEASWVFTGEVNSFKGYKVRHALDLKSEKKGFGALELAGRVGGSKIDADAFKDGYASAKKSANKVTTYGVGLNWFPITAVRFAVAYDHSNFKGYDATYLRRAPEDIVTVSVSTGF